MTRDRPSAQDKTEDQADYEINYQLGKAAFERGDYRRSIGYLEAAKSLVNPNSLAGGEIQIWLVTAYDAAGERDQAIALCRELTTHPSLNARKEAKRIVYILEAPKLKTRPEWLTQIPDLTALSDDAKPQYVAPKATDRPPEKRKFQVESVDLSQVNTEDNRFIWVALGAVVVVLLSLVWLSQRV
jgi:tetratricopeptide (TPR) repeat protein